MSELNINHSSPMQPDFPVDNHHQPLAESHQSEEMQKLISLFAEENNPESADTLEDELFFHSDADESLTANHPDVERLETTINQLEQALAVSEQQLQAQIERSHSTDILIAQQTEELNETQQQIAYLVDTLESSQEETQNQRLQIETFAEQLTASQEQMAHLERECALLKEECQEKTQKLFTAEKHIRELISRLQRQQRYTLQYKSALEQYLESPTLETENQPIAEANPAIISSKVTEIKPWSIQQDAAVSIPNQELNRLESAAEESDSPVKITAELEFVSEQTDFSEQETALVAEDSVMVNAASMPEEITDTEMIPAVDNRQNLTKEIKKPNFPPLLIPSNRKSKGIVDLPSFLRHRSSSS